MDESKSKVFCSAEYCRKLKDMLKAAMADLENAEDCDSCIYNGKSCPGVSGDCEYKWKHHDEAMQLMGQEEKPKSPCYFEYCINCANLIRHTIPGEAGFSEVRCSLKHRGIPMRGKIPSLINIITPEDFDKSEEERAAAFEDMSMKPN